MGTRDLAYPFCGRLDLLTSSALFEDCEATGMPSALPGIGLVRVVTAVIAVIEVWHTFICLVAYAVLCRHEAPRGVFRSRYSAADVSPSVDMASSSPEAGSASR